MIVAFDEDLLAPMLAGWQKVADCYRPRVYVFRAARKIFAVTNQEQGVGELVIIIEPTPRSEDPTGARRSALYDVSDAKSRLPPDLRRRRSNRSARSDTEPTLDEVLRKPAIRLIMRRDNVNEDQLLHLIKLVRRHINGLVSLGSGRSEMSIHLGMWRDGPIAQSKGGPGCDVVTERCLGLPRVKCAGCADLWDADGG